MPEPSLRGDLRRAWRLTRYWATVSRNHLPPNRGRSLWVLGHPRSGTNWFCRILNAYYGIPIHMGGHHRLPVLHPVILHLHRFASVRRRTIYMMRDGRDVVLSQYFKTVESWPRKNPRLVSRVARHCPAPFTAEHVRENLPGYIRFLFEENRSSSLPYPAHLRRARQLGLYAVRFEDLLRDDEATISGAIRFLEGREADIDRVRRAAEDTSFEKRTGRRRGEEQTGRSVRKGVVGDWRNHFSREAACAFARYAGPALIEAGYASDDSWVEEASPDGS